MFKIKHLARTNNAPFFSYIALDNLKTAYNSFSLQQKIESTETFDDGMKFIRYEQQIQKNSVSCIVFAAMAIEAYIYDYGARHLSDSYVTQHLDKLDVVSKWIIIPKIATGNDFPKDNHAFELLKKLIKTRNSYIHYKSAKVHIEDLSEIYQPAHTNLEKASTAIEVLILLAEIIKELDPRETGESFHDFTKKELEEIKKAHSLE